MKNFFNYGLSVGASVLTILTTGANAQSLPNVQSASVTAPGNIKVDGKQTEWGGCLQAYNKAIECRYTLANNNEGFYFVLQAEYDGVVQKIAAGGITLTLSRSDKQDGVLPVVITFLKTPMPYDAGIGYTLRNHKILSDTLLDRLNNQMSGHIKEISISGAKGITDSAISVYNNLGIKAMGLLDRNKVYTCELVIPLKYLSQVIDESGGFSYLIQVNGLDTSGKNGFKVVGGKSTTAPPSEAPVDHASGMFLLAPTNVKGVYTLAK